MSVRRPGRCRMGALAVLLAASAAVSFAPPAWAHASLVSSSPSQGQHLDELPAQVRFDFSQDMSAPAYVIVTAPDGSSVTSDDPVVDGAVVTQDVTAGPDGAYTMAYRAVSADGHPVTGEIQFTVGRSMSASPSAPAASSSPAAAGSADLTPGPDAEEPGFVGRHTLAITGGVLLFGGAGVLLLLARRSEA